VDNADYVRLSGIGLTSGGAAVRQSTLPWFIGFTP
jgi:hypothetical protein